jgi:hypothetical protein
MLHLSRLLWGLFLSRQVGRVGVVGVSGMLLRFAPLRFFKAWVVAFDRFCKRYFESRESPGYGSESAGILVGGLWSVVDVCGGGVVPRGGEDDLLGWGCF